AGPGNPDRRDGRAAAGAPSRPRRVAGGGTTPGRGGGRLAGSAPVARQDRPVARRVPPLPRRRVPAFLQSRVTEGAGAAGGRGVVGVRGVRPGSAGIGTSVTRRSMSRGGPARGHRT